MATIKRFEDLLAWKKSRELAKEVYRLTSGQKFSKDYGLKDQIQRAAVSIMSNIAEGFERGTKQELINFLFIAKGSAGEVRTQLYIAYDIGYLNVSTFRNLKLKAEEISKLLHSLIVKIKTGSRKGLQYKAENRPKTKFDLMMDEVMKKRLKQDSI